MLTHPALSLKTFEAIEDTVPRGLIIFIIYHWDDFAVVVLKISWMHD